MYKHNIQLQYWVYVPWSGKNNTDLIRHVVTDFRVQGCILCQVTNTFSKTAIKEKEKKMRYCLQFGIHCLKASSDKQKHMHINQYAL